VGKEREDDGDNGLHAGNMGWADAMLGQARSIRSYRSPSNDNRTAPEKFGLSFLKTEVVTKDRIFGHFGFGPSYFGFGLQSWFFMPGQNEDRQEK
jgi:hypothetical protein